MAHVSERIECKEFRFGILSHESFGDLSEEVVGLDLKPTTCSELVVEKSKIIQNGSFMLEKML
jgi:hypothetical protein